MPMLEFLMRCEGFATKNASRFFTIMNNGSGIQTGNVEWVVGAGQRRRGLATPILSRAFLNSIQLCSMEWKPLVCKVDAGFRSSRLCGGNTHG